MAVRKIRTEVVFEDERFLVVNKPAGLLSIPDRYDATLPTVLSVLNRPSAIPVHRLDRETSGLIVLAKDEEALRSLNEQFSQRSVVKVYHALVSGEPAETVFTVDQPIAVNQGRGHRSIIDQDGKPSQTDFTLLRSLGPYSLIEARPRTGRTHQIRVHLAHARLPLIADDLYGNGKPFYLSSVKRSYTPGRNEERPLLGRLGLHALSLEFDHPESGDRLSFEAPYAKDFRASINQLAKLFG